MRPVLFILCWLTGSSLSWAGEELVVVVHASNELSRLSRTQISDLFLGRSTSFPNGRHVTVVEQTRDSRTREEFFKRINGMSLNQVNTYWARLTFSGRVTPPFTVPNSREVVRTIATNPNAIGYIHPDALDDSVRTVLDLRD
ncbi:MAG: hypothetical protein H7834_09410 [Magnetococcus sp. YQC-9]